MPLIDSTYFEDSNIIANVSEPDPDYKTDKVLDRMIIKGERDVLSFAFGIEMWIDFKPYIKSGIDPNTPQSYLDIINGKTYEKDGKKCYWKGLIQEDTKESLLADYVYCEYHTDNITTTTGIGEVAINNKVGNRVSMIPKVVKVWNRMIESLHGNFRSNPQGFTIEGAPYWIVKGCRDYYGIYPKYGEVSLMQFLFDNKDLYPLLDLNYRRFGEFKNEFGI
ncbi:hypothetical protein [Chryseobacterium bernardetii]|uniref:hypothetical protein n=1 Tax=Chryseobacterium bernardetii TaxID=1241978 RepID=UPI001626FD78|nr:hypothetical protein [Chryseobacterium bernardetii]